MREEDNSDAGILEYMSSAMMESITHRVMGPIDGVMIKETQLKRMYVVLHVKKNEAGITLIL